ncbi:hypothetical protein [Pseudomonas faucium]|uniref:hypothetical protein n=1 Tax=Pseudomonas faucium TaxID=2740518 RepID=UPI0039C030BC
MPTENRSSNTEMVSVPRQLTREMLNAVCMHPDLARSLWSALLKNAPQPAEQQQAEPDGYRWQQLGGNGWCYGEKLPAIIIGAWQELYTHPGPGEIELLRTQQAETIKLITWLCNDIDSGMTSTWHAKLQNHLDGLRTSSK